MADVPAFYARGTDEIGHSATLTLSGATANVRYPATNVQLLKPSTVFLTSTTGTVVDLVFDHGSAVDLQLFSLHHHNLPAGTNVRIQRHATNSWGAPTMDGAVVIGTYPQVGLPSPVGVDLTAVTGYNGVTGFRYTRLHIPILAQLVGLGAVCLWAAKRVDLTNVRYPVSDEERQPESRWATAYGAQISYRFGIRLRAQPFTFRHRDAGWAAFLTLFRASGPFLWWRDPTGSDAMLCRFDSDTMKFQLPVNTVHDVSDVMRELGAGLAIPTA